MSRGATVPSNISGLSAQAGSTLERFNQIENQTLRNGIIFAQETGVVGVRDRDISQKSSPERSELIGSPENTKPEMHYARFDANGNVTDFVKTLFDGSNFILQGLRNNASVVLKTILSKEELATHVQTNGVTVDGSQNSASNYDSFVNFYKNGAFQGGIATAGEGMTFNAYHGVVFNLFHPTYNAWRQIDIGTWDSEGQDIGISPRVSAGSYLGGNATPWYYVIAHNFKNASDRNVKHDIEYFDNVDSTEIIMSLKPCSYKFNNDSAEKTNYGFIAQDVEEALQNLGVDTDSIELVSKGLDKDGKEHYSLNYIQFIPLMVDTIQEQQKRIDDLEERLAKLESKITI